MNVNKSWITMGDAGLATLSINTLIDETKPHMKPLAKTIIFPAVPTKEDPKKQTITIGLFDREDLLKIKETIDNYVGFN